MKIYFQFICISCFIISSCQDYKSQPKYILSKKIYNKHLGVSIKLPDNFISNSPEAHHIFIEKFASDSIEVDLDFIYNFGERLKVQGDRFYKSIMVNYSMEDPRNFFVMLPDEKYVLNEENAINIIYTMDRGVKRMFRSKKTKRFYGKVRRTNKFNYLAAKYSIIERNDKRISTVESYYIEREFHGILIFSFVNTPQEDFVEEMIRSIELK